MSLERSTPGRVVSAPLRYARSYYKGANLDEKESILGILLIIPSILLIGGLIVYPFLYNVYLSFHEVPLTPGEGVRWNDFAHYEWLINSNEFWVSLATTITFTAFTAVFATAGGLLVALLLQREFRGRRAVRGMTLLPYVAPIIAVAFVWRWMFQNVYGIIPYIMRQLGFVELANTPWLGNPLPALAIVIIFDTWRYFPFAFLFIIARVQAIPEEMYEAARIDGASRFAMFKDITLPELKYVLATVILLRSIWNFNKFSDVWLLTHEVEVLSIFTYQTAFSTFRQGRAAAIAMVLFLFLITFSTIYVSRFLDW
jgi:multiple sugar transport system permease protein